MDFVSDMFLLVGAMVCVGLGLAAAGFIIAWGLNRICTRLAATYGVVKVVRALRDNSTHMPWDGSKINRRDDEDNRPA